jgi:aryl-alcohol dehydrogenase-like predicted oxidoreductase
MLGQSLKNLNIARKDIVLATTFGLRTGPGRNDTGASRNHVMDCIEGSLQRLQTDYIDLYQIHTDDTITPIEETLRTLDTLVRQGKVRYIGCSNWQAWRLAKALGISELKNLIRLDTVQAHYSLASRDIERELIPFVESEKTGLLVWSPLAAGLLSGKFSRENEKPQGSRRSTFDFPYVDKERAWKILDTIAPIAKAHGCSPARISLAWLLTRPAVTSVILGAKRPDQLRDNLAATDVTLTQGEIAQLNGVSALPPEFPGWVSWFADPARVQP